MTVEVATILPIFEGFESSQWTLDEPTNAFNATFGYGASQIVRFNTAKWAAKIRYGNMALDDRQWLARFAAYVGTHRPFWVRDPSHTTRGSFPATELLTNPYAAATWSPGTNRSVVADNEGVRLTRTGATQASTLALASSVAVTANANYAFRTIVEHGAGGVIQIGMAAGSTGTGSTYGSLTKNAVGGRKTLRCVPTASPMFVSYTDDITLDANYSQQPWAVLRAQSLVRSFLVDGGSGSLTQTGSGIYVKALPTSTNGLIAAGDMVEIVSAGFSQMVRVAEAINSDSSGLGYMKFEPQLRGGVVANDLIIPYRPMVQMRLVRDPSIDTRPGHFSDVELELMEHFG